MSVGEQDSLGGKAIDVRSERLWVAIEAADPIVEVINGDEKNIGLLLSLGNCANKNPKKVFHVTVGRFAGKGIQ